MTDNEIIKALEYCSKINRKRRKTGEKPYGSKGNTNWYKYM